MATLISGSTGVNKIQDGTIVAADMSGTLADQNTPAFLGYSANAAQGIFLNTWTKVNNATEQFDSDSCYTNGVFTPTTAGKYVLTGMVEYSQQDNNAASYVAIYKNGARIAGGRWFLMNPLGGGGGENTTNQLSIIAPANGSSDYFSLYVYQASGTRNVGNVFGIYTTHFSGYRLAGVS